MFYKKWCEPLLYGGRWIQTRCRMPQERPMDQSSSGCGSHWGWGLSRGQTSQLCHGRNMLGYDSRCVGHFLSQKATICESEVPVVVRGSCRKADLDVGAHMLVKPHIAGFSQSWPELLVIAESSACSALHQQIWGLLHPWSSWVFQVSAYGSSVWVHTPFYLTSSWRKIEMEM